MRGERGRGEEGRKEGDTSRASRSPNHLTYALSPHRSAYSLIC